MGTSGKPGFLREVLPTEMFQPSAFAQMMDLVVIHHTGITEPLIQRLSDPDTGHHAQVC